MSANNTTSSASRKLHVAEEAPKAPPEAEKYKYGYKQKMKLIELATFDNSLKPFEKVVFSAIVSYANYEHGGAWPSQETLARRLDRHITRINVALQGLFKKNWIKKKLVRSEKTDKNHLVYWPNIDLIDGSDHPVAANENDDAPADRDVTNCADEGVGLVQVAAEMKESSDSGWLTEDDIGDGDPDDRWMLADDAPRSDSPCPVTVSDDDVSGIVVWGYEIPKSTIARLAVENDVSEDGIRECFLKVATRPCLESDDEHCTAAIMAMVNEEIVSRHGYRDMPC